jgi:hypothetical protein
MKSLEPEVLRQLYIVEQQSIYAVSQQLECNHKTVRAYLIKHGIPLRTASEYNYLPRSTHVEPSIESCFTPKAVAAHVAYLCEGWHTPKTNMVQFVNQDPQLIDLVAWLLKEVYQVKRVRIVVAAATKEQAEAFLTLYPEARYAKDPSRKNPIIQVKAGGWKLARNLIENAYSVLRSLG